MEDMVFLLALRRAFTFLTYIIGRYIDVFNQHHWLFSMVIAPTLVAVIIFGINLSVSLVNKNSAGKGER